MSLSTKPCLPQAGSAAKQLKGEWCPSRRCPAASRLSRHGAPPRPSPSLTLLLRPLHPAPWFYSRPARPCSGGSLPWELLTQPQSPWASVVDLPGQRADAAGRTWVLQTSPWVQVKAFKAEHGNGKTQSHPWDCSQDDNYSMGHANIPPAVFKAVTTNMVEKWFRGQSPTESKLWTFASIAPKRQQNTHT